MRYLLTGSGLFLSPLPQCAIFARSALINEDGHVVTDGPSDLHAHDPTNIPDFEIMPIPYMVSRTLYTSAELYLMLAVLLRLAGPNSRRLASPARRLSHRTFVLSSAPNRKGLSASPQETLGLGRHAT